MSREVFRIVWEPALAEYIPLSSAFRHIATFARTRARYREEIATQHRFVDEFVCDNLAQEAELSSLRLVLRRFAAYVFARYAMRVTTKTISWDRIAFSVHEPDEEV